MQPVSSLRPRVAIEARNAPNPLIDRSLVAAARELCEAAAIWREVITIDSTAGTDTFDLGDRVSASGEIVRVVDVTSEDRAFRHYAMPGPRTLVLTEKPPAALVVSVALRPTQGADQLPDVLALDYPEAVISGALYRLLRMPSVAWSNAELAMHHRRLFRGERMNVIHAVNRGFEQKSLRVNPRRFSIFRGQRC